MMWNNTKKAEKQLAVNDILKKLSRNEIAYIGEIFLKQTQINLLRANYSKMFSHLSSLKTWFRQRIMTPL